MLQHLWPCNGTFLVYMADHEYGDAFIFGQTHERHGTVLHLGDTAGRGIQKSVIHGLNRVDDQYIGLEGGDGFQDAVQIGLDQDI